MRKRAPSRRGDRGAGLRSRAPPTLENLHNLGRLTESEAENRAVLAVWARDLGPESISTLLRRGNLARVLADLGKTQEAEAEARAVLEIRTRVLGPELPHTADIRRLVTTLPRT